MDDSVMAVVAEEDKPKDTGEEFGFIRRIAARPSEPAEAAVARIWGHVPPVLAAIEATVSDSTEVVYALGCHVHDPSTEGIAEAVAAAKGSDVAILVLGDKTGLVADAVVGETRDRTTLELAGAQRPLLEAVCATGVPVVVVLLGSQPVPVYANEGGPAAVIYAYQPGSVGGVAIADILFGVENPSGRVPITIPRTEGQCPIFHGHKHGGEPSTYTGRGSADGWPIVSGATAGDGIRDHRRTGQPPRPYRSPDSVDGRLLLTCFWHPCIDPEGSKDFRWYLANGLLSAVTGTLTGARTAVLVSMVC